MNEAKYIANSALYQVGVHFFNTAKYMEVFYLLWTHVAATPLSEDTTFTGAPATQRRVGKAGSTWKNMTGCGVF